MAHRKSRLQLKHQDLAVNVDIRTAKLTPEAVTDRPEIVRRDGTSGSLVIRQLYDKATGEPLTDGYGYRWINEDGAEVPHEDLVLFTIEDETETSFSMHEPTLGADRTVTAETWIPVGTIDSYLIQETYELWGEEPGDIAQLSELAAHIREFDEAPVIPFVLRESLYRRWGIITPFFFEDTFALIIRVTDQQIEPEHVMPMLTPAEAAAMERDEEQPSPLEQDSPFE